jgi:ArsR family metal-binding transcriptional regulator
MDNVIPITRLLPQYACGKCGEELFILVEDKEGKLIAICSSCRSPSTQIGCGCLDYLH